MSFQFSKNKNGNCRLCNDPDSRENLVACDECDRWFHLSCAKLKHPPRKDERWICIKCTSIENEVIKLKSRASSSTSGIEEMLNIQRNSMEALVRSIRDMKGESVEANASGSVSEVSTLIKRQSLVELPYFDGSYKVWPRFKMTFEETTREGSFSDLENLNRLQKYLKGDAMKLVNTLLIDKANMKIAMEKLEQRFGSPEIIYSALLKEVLNQKNPKFDSPQTVIDVN